MLYFYLTMIDTLTDKYKFEMIYNEYDMFLHSVAYNILKDQHLAEDAVQECYLKVIKHLKCIEEPIALKTKSFLSIVVKNTCLDMIKKRSRRPETDLDENIEIPTPDEMNPRIDFEVLVERVHTLPPIYKDIIFLKYNHQCGNAEIAKLLNISVEVVKKRFQRARDILEKELTGVIR